MTWQFTLSGFLIGALVGMTGMGGGSLLTPILVIVFGFKPTLAVGTDILHGAIFKSFGAVRHRRLGTVHARLTFWMFLGSGPMSLLGVAIATWLKHHYGGAESSEAYAVGIALMAGGAGNVGLRRMGWLLTGSVPGVWLARQFTLRVPGRVLRLGLACVLMLSGVKLVAFPHADWAIVAGVIVAGLGFAAWGLVSRLG